MKLNSGDIDVTKEDQQKINTFSRLNMLYHDKLKEQQSLKDQNQGFQDALEEMELMDDDETISYKFGDCFIKVTVTKARELIAQQTEKLKLQQKEVSQVLEETKKQMNNLKAKLYAKFGNQINLDED